MNRHYYLEKIIMLVCVSVVAGCGWSTPAFSQVANYVEYCNAYANSPYSYQEGFNDYVTFDPYDFYSLQGLAALNSDNECSGYYPDYYPNDYSNFLFYSNYPFYDYYPPVIYYPQYINENEQNEYYEHNNQEYYNDWYGHNRGYENSYWDAEHNNYLHPNEYPHGDSHPIVRSDEPGTRNKVGDDDVKNPERAGEHPARVGEHETLTRENQAATTHLYHAHPYGSVHHYNVPVQQRAQLYPMLHNYRGPLHMYGPRTGSEPSPGFITQHVIYHSPDSMPPMFSRAPMPEMETEAPREVPHGMEDAGMVHMQGNMGGMHRSSGGGMGEMHVGSGIGEMHIGGGGMHMGGGGRH